jgi:hypothetical protein
MPTIHERLEAIKAELARQDREWERVRHVLADTKARHILVSNEVLAAIDATARVPVAGPVGMRA